MRVRVGKEDGMSSRLERDTRVRKAQRYIIQDERRRVKEGLLTPPTMDEVEEWMTEDSCQATDGCWVEPDGWCEHNHPSWLLVLGVI
jgi:hypothetical protein